MKCGVYTKLAEKYAWRTDMLHMVNLLLPLLIASYDAWGDAAVAAGNNFLFRLSRNIVCHIR